MTLATNLGSERADEAGWPWSHRRTFLERLGTQGYAAVTIQEYPTDTTRLLTYFHAVILRHLAEDQVVLVSHSMPLWVPKGIGHMLRVRTVAPIEVRKKRVIDEECLSRRQAEHRVRESDRRFRRECERCSKWTLRTRNSLAVRRGLFRSRVACPDSQAAQLSLLRRSKYLRPAPVNRT
jgi:cytidylate kinase-like protein